MIREAANTLAQVDQQGFIQGATNIHCLQPDVTADDIGFLVDDAGIGTGRPSQALGNGAGKLLLCPYCALCNLFTSGLIQFKLVIRVERHGVGKFTVQFLVFLDSALLQVSHAGVDLFFGFPAIGFG